MKLMRGGHDWARQTITVRRLLVKQSNSQYNENRAYAYRIPTEAELP